MRETWVRIVAAVSGMLVILLALVFARLQNPPGAVSAQESAAAFGHEVFLARGCARCHAVAGEGNLRSPLDGVGERRDPAALRDWILATGPAGEALPARARHAKADYRTLPDDELAALIVFLQSRHTGSVPPRRPESANEGMQK